jgi:hypothetical protein
LHVDDDGNVIAIATNRDSRLPVGVRTESLRGNREGTSQGNSGGVVYGKANAQAQRQFVGVRRSASDRVQRVYHTFGCGASDVGNLAQGHK